MDAVESFMKNPDQDVLDQMNKDELVSLGKYLGLSKKIYEKAKYSKQYC